MYYVRHKIAAISAALLLTTVPVVPLQQPSSASKIKQSTTLGQEFTIDFYQAMKHSRLFKENQAQRDPQWQMLNRWYNTALKQNYTAQDAYKIPNIFHLIWLGSPVPERYQLLSKRLKELHPDAQVYLWTDKEVESLTLTRRKAFDAESNYGAKSDILRYELLYAYGGVYLDGDFEVKKPLSNLLRVCSLFTGLAYNERKIEMYNGLIGSTPGHPVIKECLESIKPAKSAHELKDLDAIIARTGPGQFTDCVLKKGDTAPGLTVAFPVAFFYPWPNYERHNKSAQHKESFIKPYSFTVHQWAASWTNAFESAQKQKNQTEPKRIIKHKPPSQKANSYKQQTAQQKKNKFVVVTLTYNNERFCQENILATLNQKFPADQYRVIVINDASTDRTEELLFKTLENHPRASLVTYVENSTRRGGMANYITAAYMCDYDEIMVHVDGDDRFIRQDALSIIDSTYTEDVWLTYGSYINKSDGKLGFFNGELPDTVIINNRVRHYDWVTSHIRTCRAWLFWKVPLEAFMYQNGWLPCCTDLAIMWPLIEMAGEKHIRRITTPVYEYNDTSELNLFKVARNKVLEVNNYLKHKKPFNRI